MTSELRSRDPSNPFPMTTFESFSVKESYFLPERDLVSNHTALVTGWDCHTSRPLSIKKWNDKNSCVTHPFFANNYSVLPRWCIKTSIKSSFYEMKILLTMSLHLTGWKGASSYRGRGVHDWVTAVSGSDSAIWNKRWLTISVIAGSHRILSKHSSRLFFPKVGGDVLNRISNRTHNVSIWHSLA